MALIRPKKSRKGLERAYTTDILIFHTISPPFVAAALHNRRVRVCTRTRSLLAITGFPSVSPPFLLSEDKFYIWKLRSMEWLNNCEENCENYRENNYENNCENNNENQNWYRIETVFRARCIACELHDVTDWSFEIKKKKEQFLDWATFLRLVTGNSLSHQIGRW